MIFLVGFAAVLFSATWHLDRSRRLFAIAILIAIGQALLSSGLYWMTTLPLPEINRFVLGPGFWSTFGDAYTYFHKSINLDKFGFSVAAEHPPSALFVIFLNLAIQGIKKPEIGGIVLNGLVHLATIPCVYYFLYKIRNDKAAIWAAAGIGTVSSMYLYSSQILRDPLIWVVFLILLGCVVSVVNQTRPGSSNTKFIHLALYFAILCTNALLTEMRIWLPLCVIFSVVIALIAKYCETKKLSHHLLSLIGCLLLGFFIGQINPVSKLSSCFATKKTLPYKLLGKGESAIKAEKDQYFIELNSSIQKNSDDIFQTSTLGLQRIKEKIIKLKNDWKSLGIIFLVFDLIGLVVWKNLMEKTEKTILIKNTLSSLFKNPVNAILISLIVEIIIVSVIYSDTTGNLPRYLCLVVFPFVFYQSSNLKCGTSKKNTRLA